VRVVVGEDGSVYALSGIWSSVGLDVEGGTYPRRGRASVVLKRGPDGALRAVHTHFSMSRGSPARWDQP